MNTRSTSSDLGELRSPHLGRDVALLVALATGGLPSVTTAQEPSPVVVTEPKQDFIPPRTAQRLTPSRQEVSSYTLRVPDEPDLDALRVKIVRGEYEPLRGAPPTERGAAESGARGAPVTYFHTPLPMLVAHPEGGLIWHRENLHSLDGQDITSLSIRIVASTPTFREQCRELVLRDDDAYVRSVGASRENVSVMLYPITGATVLVSMRDLPGEPLLAVPVRGLEYKADSFTVRLPLRSGRVAEFEELLQRNLLEIEVRYDYLGHTSSQVTQSAELDQEAQKDLQGLLSSAQGDFKGAILQNERNVLANRLLGRIRTLAHVKGTSAIPLYRASVDHLLAQIATDHRLTGAEARALCNQPEVRARLASYLQALPQRLNLSNVETKFRDATDARERSDQRGRTTSTGVSGSLGVSFGPVTAGVSGSYQQTNQEESVQKVLKAVRDQYGIVLQKVSDSEFYEPHEIACSQWLQQGEQVKLDHVSIVSLAGDDQVDGLPAMIIDPRFNTARFGRFQPH